MRGVLVKAVVGGFVRRTKTGKVVYVGGYASYRTHTTQGEVKRILKAMRHLLHQAKSNAVTGENVKANYEQHYTRLKSMLNETGQTALNKRFGDRLPTPDEITKTLQSTHYLRYRK